MKPYRVIIIEDEHGAANSLKLLLNEVAPSLRLDAILASIEQAMKWLADSEAPDLAFVDIQLEDGLSFEIFKQREISFPVIFTTAFDQYAIEAFKENSIDYLLKPIKEADLLRSLQKYERLAGGNVERKLAERLIDTLTKGQGLSSFLVHHKNKLIPLVVNEVSYFYISNGLVRACTTSQHYPIELTLDELEAALDGRFFLRANRQFIINKKAIKDIDFYFNGRLAVNMQVASPDAIIISKTRVPVFKDWMKN